MAITIDPATKVISIPQSDCTLVSGTVYTMNTQTVFRAQVNTLLASEDYIWMDDAIAHNTEYTIAGLVYARSIGIINGYTIQFTPDAQWSVVLEGSNNDLWDVLGGILVQNQVQVIPTNSAGLVNVSQLAGGTPQEIWEYLLTSGQQAQAELIKARLNAGNAFAVSASKD